MPSISMPRRSLATALTIGLVAGAVAVLTAQPTGAADRGRGSDNAVLTWNQTLLHGVRTSSLGPPMVARALGVAHTCMYDAWAAYDNRAHGTQFGDGLRQPPRERTRANREAAVSYAAYHAALDLLPHAKAHFDRVMRDLGYAPTTNPDHTTSAGATGITACRAVLEFRHNDRSNQMGDLSPGAYSDYSDYQPVNEPMVVDQPLDPDTVRDPDRWQPLIYPDKTGRTSVQEFLAPHWGRVTPFAYQPKRRPKLSGFARYGTDEFVEQVAELVEISANLTDRQKAIAELWADGPNSEQPPGHWMLFGQYVSRRDHHGLDEDAKMFFVLGNAVMDAGIAAWGLKRQEDCVRPITAIRYLYRGQKIAAWAGPGRGTAVIDGETWLPYQPTWFPTPPFAEWVSGHSAFSAAGAEVLKRFTGSDRFGASVTVRAGSSFVEPDTPRTDVVLFWPTFSAAAEEAGVSRRYGGIHPRAGDVDGRRIGRYVGERVWERAESLWNGRPES